MRTRTILRLAFQLFVLTSIVLFASRGGYHLIYLLAVPFVAWNTYTIFWPPSGAPAGRFTEPGRYRVVLQVPGVRAVKVVQQLRLTTGADLSAARHLIDAAPVVVVEDLSEQSAELVADRLRKAGARALAAPIEEM